MLPPDGILFSNCIKVWEEVQLVASNFAIKTFRMRDGWTVGQTDLIKSTQKIKHIWYLLYGVFAAAKSCG